MGIIFGERPRRRWRGGKQFGKPIKMGLEEAHKRNWSGSVSIHSDNLAV